MSDYAWAPDSKRLVLVVSDPDPAVAAAEDESEKAKEGPPKTPKPIVVDRYHFKSDGDGFLRGERTHLYLFDIAAKKAEIAHARRVQRNVSGVVARRQSDRVHPPAWRR